LDKAVWKGKNSTEYIPPPVKGEEGGRMPFFQVRATAPQNSFARPCK